MIPEECVNAIVNLFIYPGNIFRAMLRAISARRYAMMIVFIMGKFVHIVGLIYAKIIFIYFLKQILNFLFSVCEKDILGVYP